MATFDFQTVLVWTTNPGGVVRLLRNGAVTVYNAATDAVLSNLTSDSAGLVSFTTTDVATVYLKTTGWTSEHITAASAIEAAAAFTVSEDAAVANLVNDPGSSTRAGLNSTIATAVAEVALVAEKYPSVQAALDACPAGGTVLITASHTLAGNVLAPPRAMTIRLAPGVVLTQATWGYPVFDVVNVDRVRIDGHLGRIVSTATRVQWPGGAFRSDNPAAYWSGVWCNGSYCDFDVVTSGFTCGVYLSGAVAALTNHATASKVGNRVKIVSDSDDFALNFLCQVDLEVVSITASNTTMAPVNGAPPHAIYGSGNPTLRSKRVTCGPLVSSGNPYSYAFQFKYVDGLTVASMLADNTAGLINLIDNTQVTIGDGRLLSAAASTPQVILANIQRVTAGQSDSHSIGTLTLPQQSGVAAAVASCFSVVGSNISVEKLIVSTNVTDTESPNNMVGLAGEDISIGEIIATAKGRASAVVGIPANTTRVRIRDIQTNVGAARNLVNVDATATDVVFNYNPAQVGPLLGGNPIVRPTGGSAIGYKATLGEYERMFTVTGGSVSANKPDCFASTRTHYKITDTAAFTMGNHTSTPFIGMYHEIVIENGSAGALGTPTWPATWTVTNYTAPAAGALTRLRFRWNGTAWVQVV